MKKVLLSLIVFLYALSVQAQGFRVGMSGGINSTWLMNKNVFDQDDGLDIASSFGGRLGIDAIYAFSEKTGISIGFNFISTHNQKYSGENKGPIHLNGDSKTKLNYLDIPILFRLTSSSGTYFEIGPQIGILNSAKLDYDETNGISYSNLNIKNGFNSTNVALILGFGVDIDIVEKLYITTGLRLGYGFSDVTKEYSTNTEMDINTIDESPTYFAHIDDNNQFNYEKTTRVFGGLHLGVSYKFGGE